MKAEFDVIVVGAGSAGAALAARLSGDQWIVRHLRRGPHPGSIWHSGWCAFVGDMKYKRVQAEGILHPDLYRVLAFCVATQLDAELLIYAAGEVDHPVVHTIRHVGRRIEVRTLDLAGDPTQILAQIATLARRIEGLQHAAQIAA